MYLTIVDGQMQVDTEHDFADYDTMRAFIGGPLECIPVPFTGERQLVAFIHEEGKLESLPDNFYSRECEDVINGPCIITAQVPSNDGMITVSMTQAEVESLMLVRLVGSNLPVLLLNKKSDGKFGVGQAHT